MNLGLDQGGPEREIGRVDRYRRSWKNPAHRDMNMSRSESVNSSSEKDVGISAKFKNSVGSLRSREIRDQWGVERYHQFGGFYRNSKSMHEQGRFTTFAYHDEGPSNYKLGSFYSHGDLDGVGRIEYLEQDRAELLRKLDELKDQIGSAYDVEEKPREIVHVDRKIPHFNHSHGAGPFMQKFYFPPSHVPNEIPRSEDQFRPQMIRRPPQDFPRQYMDFNQDSLAYHPQESFVHHHACSCSHCCNKHRQGSPQVVPAVFSNRRFSATFGPQGYNPRGANHLHSQGPQQLTRWLSSLDSDIDGFRSCPRRVVVARRNKQFLHPIASGAPFITCYNCFELLKLPKKLKMAEKNQQKLQCGACSTIILLKSDNKRLIISVPMESKPRPAKDNDDSCEALDDSDLSSRDCLKVSGEKSCSENFDNPCYENLQSQDTKHNFLSEDNRMKCLSESEKRQGVPSSSAIYSEEEVSQDSVIVHGDVCYPAELPSKDELSPRLSGLPFQVHFDDISSKRGVSINGKVNESKRRDQENVSLNKKVSRQNSMEDASLASEVEVSEYINTSLSQDSVDVRDRSRINKGGEFFLVGLIKKGFRDLSRSNQTAENEECNVLVNGQPIPDRVVKKAEKLAGPIHPGDYWYDFRGGFWGVMGQPCQGIIPSFIDEFNYPMPTNCAAGSTGVYVNGRELHTKDLDLLASRGLPTTSDKFYIIEISGRVVDEDSGEELESLGKLAPSVEMANRGFGMQVRKVVDLV